MKGDASGGNADGDSLKTIASELLAHTVTFEQSQEQYKNWALRKNYDEMLLDKSEYRAPNVLLAKALELFINPELPLILDLGAGTGIVAKLLNDGGFKTIHALEPLQEFIDIAKTKDVYQKFYSSCIGGGSAIDCSNDQYDAVVASGAFGPGHIPCDSFHEIIRILKPGGYFINCMRHGHLHNVLEYKDRLEPLAKQLEEEGKWRRITWETYPNHFMGHEGLLMVFQCC